MVWKSLLYCFQIVMFSLICFQMFLESKRHAGFEEVSRKQMFKKVILGASLLAYE